MPKKQDKQQPEDKQIGHDNKGGFGPQGAGGFGGPRKERPSQPKEDPKPEGD